MTNGWNIQPNISEVDAVRMELVAMAAVVLHIPAAMTTHLNGGARTTKRGRLALGVIDHAVVRGIQTTGNWQRVFYVHRNPMAKQHSGVVEEVSELNVPTRQIEEIEGTARFE